MDMIIIAENLTILRPCVLPVRNHCQQNNGDLSILRAEVEETWRSLKNGGAAGMFFRKSARKIRQTVA